MNTKSIGSQLLVVGVVLGLFSAGQAKATDAFFIGSAGDHLLTTPSNWVGGVAAGDWDRMIFGSAVVDGTLDIDNFNGRSGITLTSGVTQDITIISVNGAFGPQPLIMGAVTSDGGIDMSSATHDLTINAQYWMWSNTNWNIGAGRTLFVNGGISNPSGITLTKDGTGNAWITQPSSFDGGTTINAGALVPLRGALGTGPVVINNGGTVYANDQWVFSGVNGYAVSYPNPSSVTVNAGGQLALDPGNGYANGVTNLYLNGGSVTNGPPNSNPFGGLYLYNGNEQITAGGATTSAISAILALTGNNNSITVGGGSSLNITNIMKDSGAWGAGGFIKAGAGTLSLSAANTYSGVTTLAGGVLNVASFSDYGVAGGLGNRSADGGANVGILFQGGTLQYTGSTAQSTNRAIRISTVGGATIDASGSNPAATLSFTAASSPDFFENPGTRTLTLTGSNTGANTFAMAIGEAGGATSVVKSGTGTWVLSGANTYTGNTTVNAGTLYVTGSLANNGSNSIFVTAGSATNAASDPTIKWDVANAGSFANHGSQIIGDLQSHADLLAGTNGNGLVNVNMEWRVRTGAEQGTTAYHPLVADVLNLTGMVDGLTTHGQTSNYVLQMSYDPNQLFGGLANEANLASTGKLFLAYLNGGLWQNAVLGNFGGTHTFAGVGTWAGDTTLGDWGVDTSNHTVWAVLNHNSLFSVVPEPGTFTMLAFGSVGVWLTRRKRVAQQNRLGTK